MSDKNHTSWSSSDVSAPSKRFTSRFFHVVSLHKIGDWFCLIQSCIEIQKLVALWMNKKMKTTSFVLIFLFFFPFILTCYRWLKMSYKSYANCFTISFSFVTAYWNRQTHINMLSFRFCFAMDIHSCSHHVVQA